MTISRPHPLVPKLRFPEFDNLPGWEPVQLSDVLDYEQPGKYTVRDTDYQSTGTPVLTANKSFILGHTCETEGIYHHVPVIIFDDFTTDAKYVDFPFKVKSSAIKILTSRCDDELRLVYELMSRIRFDPTQHKRYFISQYQYLKIPLPGKSEQRKIARCLGSLDKLIAAVGKKLETLRQQKKGLMQQLFPQPGETMPKLRFPEFQDGPAWELLTLSSVSSVNPKNDGLPDKFIYIDLEAVKNSILIKRQEISRDAAPSRAQRHLSRKDIIYQTVRPYQRNNLFFDIDDGCEYVASTGYAQLRAHESPEFLFQLLHTDSFVNSVLTRCTGSNYPAINPSALASIGVPLPRKTEQKKIADSLNALDDLIAVEGRKVEFLRQHKQGLMQQLFPCLETK